ncbi:MAG TPA: hypothetical protein DDW50_22650 [Firmicutes bacterium]|jgi:hypothetical protein|nr:hypothetical protein [Bacillota bacterium]
MKRVFCLILSLGLLFSIANLTMAEGALGVTDLMFSPTTKTLDPGQAGVAVNFTENNSSYFNFDLGLAKDLEVGLAAYHYPDDTDFSARVKFRLLHEKNDTPGLAVGIEDLGQDNVSPYLVLSKHFSDPGIDGYLGCGGGNFNGIFGGLDKAFYPEKGSALTQVDLYVEVDDHNLNVGTKLSLGPQVKINLGMVNMDHWIMGATFLLK